jgi:hypothetical protein
VTPDALVGYYSNVLSGYGIPGRTPLTLRVIYIGKGIPHDERSAGVSDSRRVSAILWQADATACVPRARDFLRHHGVDTLPAL